MAISYWREVERYQRLVGSSCLECHTPFFPPIRACRRCGSVSMKPQEMPKIGELVSYTFLHESITGFEEITPLAIGLIKLDNGVKIVSQIADSSPGELVIGQRMRAVFRKIRSDGHAGLIFYGYKFVIDGQ